MKKILVLLIVISAAFAASAQNEFSVRSFQKLDWDLDARTTHPMTDQNGLKAALIKVSTVETDFDFDVGVLGVVAVKQEIGEIWVYVPENVQHITIRHRKFGVIRNYKFDIPVESATVYEMVLNIPLPETPQQTILLKETVVPVTESQNEVKAVPAEGALNEIFVKNKIDGCFFANYAMGVFPELSYGAMAGWKSPLIGGYAKFRTTPSIPETSFSCTSEGVVSDGSSLWTTGKSAASRLSVTAGVVAGIWKPINVYVGAGYGQRTEAWEDYGGQWGEVTDRSFRGVSAEIGILLTLKNHLSVFAGVNTLKFKYIDAEIGFGICF